MSSRNCRPQAQYIMHIVRIRRYDFEGVFELLNYAKEFRIDSKAPMTKLRNLHPRKGQ
jgi:hypothetical protein